MDFEAFRDLVRLNAPNQVKSIELVLHGEKEDEELESLYLGIHKGKFASDFDAAEQIFGTNEKDPRYKRLRIRLIKQLNSTIFFTATQEANYNDRTKAYFNCYRDFAAANIMIARGASRPATVLLQQILTLSLRFEFTPLTSDVSRMLRYIAVRSMNDQLREDKYIELSRQYEEKRHWESIAQGYEEDLLRHYISKRSPNAKVHQLATQYYEKLSAKVKEIDTAQFYQLTYSVGIIKYFSINQCGEALKICEQAIGVLLGRESIHRGALSIFYLQKLLCLTQLRQFDGAGDACAAELFQLNEAGNFNWFRAMGIYFHHKIYARQYEAALELYRQAVEHERFEALPANVKDEWVLYGGYLHLLAAFGRLDAEAVTAAVGPLRMIRWINEVIVLDKEKDGMNIPVVLLPVLFAAVSKDYEAFDISNEALEKYRQRYLNNDLNRRSSAFLKMVIAWREREYREAETERMIAKEMEVLKSETPEISRQSFAVEIVPYEDLWDCLLSL